MASVSRMFARNWLPRPSPWLAPATRPAMSTNSTVAGTILAGWSISASFCQTIVGNGDDADVGLDGGEGVIGCQTALVREGREQRGLAHVGQTHDTDGKRHAETSLTSEYTCFHDTANNAPARCPAECTPKPTRATPLQQLCHNAAQTIAPPRVCPYHQ